MIRCATSRRAAIALYFVLAFAGALIAPPVQAQAEAAGTGLRLSGGDFDPYRFTHARLECEAGIVGSIRVAGMDWNGGRRLLYEGRSRAWTEAVDLAFYVDEGLKGIEIDAETGSGRLRLSLDLAAVALAKDVPDDVELARRAFLRDLPLPFSAPRQARPPESFRLAASSLSDAASQIAASCLCLEPPNKALAALAIFIAGAAGLAMAKRKMHPGRALAATLGLSVAATAAVILLLPREPRVTVVELPRANEGTALPYRGELVQVQEAPSGIPGRPPVARYSTSEAGDLSFLAFSTPGKGGIVLSAMEARPGSFVFSSTPVVVERGGDLELHFERWTTGWMAWQDE